MTDLITTANRALTAKEFQGLADHERAAQATEPSIGGHVCSLAYVFVPLDFKPRQRFDSSQQHHKIN